MTGKKIKNYIKIKIHKIKVKKHLRTFVQNGIIIKIINLYEIAIDAEDIIKIERNEV